MDDESSFFLEGLHGCTCRKAQYLIFFSLKHIICSLNFIGIMQSPSQVLNTFLLVELLDYATENEKHAACVASLESSIRLDVGYIAHFDQGSNKCG